MIAFIPQDDNKPAFFTSGDASRAEQLNADLRNEGLEALGEWTALTRNERKLLKVVEAKLQTPC